MCKPSTVNDLDFYDSALAGEELLCAVNSYVAKVMDEAYDLDCYDSSHRSESATERNQICALKWLRDKFGDEIRMINVPSPRAPHHAVGKRVLTWRGGMC